MNNDVNTAPSQRATVSLVKEKSQRRNTDAPITIMSMGDMPFISIGQIAAVVPRMASMLNTLLPITLPMAMAELPFFAATTLVANSGSEVPHATIVSPITPWLTPSDAATPEAESTNILLPRMSMARPAMKKKTFFSALSFFSCGVSALSVLAAFNV